MKAPKKVYGKNVYLKIPAPPDSTLELPEEVKQKIYEKFISELEELEVYAVGEECTWDIKPGDTVALNPKSLNTMIYLKLDGQDIGAIFEYHLLHQV